MTDDNTHVPTPAEDEVKAPLEREASMRTRDGR